MSWGLIWPDPPQQDSKRKVAGEQRASNKGLHQSLGSSKEGAGGRRNRPRRGGEMGRLGPACSTGERNAPKMMSAMEAQARGVLVLTPVTSFACAGCLPVLRFGGNAYVEIENSGGLR